MSWDQSLDDQYEAELCVIHVCRSCGAKSRNLVDGWCTRCNGATEELDLEAAIRTRQACERARAEQRRRQPELFDELGNWAPFRVREGRAR